MHDADYKKLTWTLLEYFKAKLINKSFIMYLIYVW